MLKFKCPLIAVSDMEKSIAFYEEVIGDRVAMNFGENVQFEGGYALQDKKKWKTMIHTNNVRRKLPHCLGVTEKSVMVPPSLMPGASVSMSFLSTVRSTTGVNCRN